MAIVKMKKLRLLAMKSESEQILKELQKLGCLEVTDSPVDFEDEEVSSLLGKEQADLSKCRAEFSELQNALKVLDKYAPAKSKLLSSRPDISQESFLDESELAGSLESAAGLQELEDGIRRLTAEEARQRNLIETLAPWRSLDIPIETTSTAMCSVLTGTVPSAVVMDEVETKLANAVEEAKLYTISTGREQHYLLLICMSDRLAEVMEVLRGFGYSASQLAGLRGTVKDNMQAAQKKLEQLDAEKQQLIAKVAEQASKRQQIKLCTDRVSTKIALSEAQERLSSTDTAMYLTGWVSSPEVGELVSLLDGYDCAWELEDPVEEEYESVPIKLENNKLTGPLNMVTEMYSLPAYGGLDPNPLMAPFFIFFYGLMMADMGYGVLMILASLVVKKKVKPRGTVKYMFEMMLSCGVVTFVMGALTGGFFGDAPLYVAQFINPETTWTGLPVLIDPLNDALSILIFALVLGVIQIFTGMAINMYKLIKRGQTMDALCNEGAWFAVFALAGVAAVTGAVMPCIIAMLVVLVLTQGHGKKGIGGKLMGIGGSLYNNITGYFSDILSYSRLMALMLAGAVIAQVFNALGAITGNIFTFLIIAIVGNALNFALNLLSCFVHDMRLQCLEFFGRFYEDGGKPFRPLAVSSNYYDIVKK